MLKRRSLKLKLTLMVIASLILLVTSILFTVRIVVTDEAKKVAIEKASTDLQTGFEIIDKTYPGPWRRDGDQLYKGDILLNGNFEIVDRIAKLTGDTVTLFCGNTRVTTNVIKDGKRAIGTTVSDIVTDTVLNKGQNYFGEADVVGHIYQTAYTPIKDATGKIIGIWYVGASQRFIDNLIQETMIAISWVSVTALIIIGLISYLIVRRICQPLIAVSKQMAIAETGDLTVIQSLDMKDGHETEDEVQNITVSFGRMIINLKEIIQNLIQVSENVAASSEEFSTAGEQVGEIATHVGESIQEVASGAEEQTAQIQETASLIFSLLDKIQEIHLKSQEMSKVADVTLENLDQGNRSVLQSMEQVNQLKDSTTQTENTLINLGQKSEKIGEIISMINNIATQTNLLALNAAIEAARAGESGRGFSVVADEIRSLAEESAAATEQITLLIKEIQKGVTATITQMKDSMEVVNFSTEVIQTTNHVFIEIKTVTKRLYQLITEVTENSEIMNQSSNQVQNVVDEIGAVSEQFAQQAEEVSASSEEQVASTEEIITFARQLAEMADQMTVIVNRFKV